MDEKSEVKVKTRVLDFGTENKKAGIVRRITVDWNGVVLTFDQPLTAKEALLEASHIIGMVTHYHIPNDT